MPYAREPWQDWTKADWMRSLPSEERCRVAAMSEDEQMDAFLEWRGKMSCDLADRRSLARKEGRIPPLEERPQYGNHAPSGALVSSSTDPYGRPIGTGGVAMMSPMGVSGRGGVGGPGGHGFGGPGGPGGGLGGHGGGFGAPGGPR